MKEDNTTPVSQNYICLNCKLVLNHEPKQCPECRHQFFHKTDAKPSPVSPQGEREPGYYWVNSDFKKEHRPRYWNGNLWFIGMDVYVKDDFWQEIDERRITRSTQPDELSKAQERIKELEALIEESRMVVITIMAVADEDEYESITAIKEGNDYLRKTSQP